LYPIFSLLVIQKGPALSSPRLADVFSVVWAIKHLEAHSFALSVAPQGRPSLSSPVSILQRRKRIAWTC